MLPTDAISAVEEVPEGTPGRPCWVEVATPDPAASSEFYRGLFGWTYRVGDDGYVMAYVEDISVAGLYTPQGGQPSQWTLYLTVHDTGNTTERVLHLGGQILTAPREIPGQGGLLIATDPSGGPIGFWRQDHGWDLGTGFPGAFTWAELNTWDGAAADEFFRHLFGFEQTQIGDGENFDYTSWRLNGDEILGRSRMGPEYPADQPPYWMVFFEVDPEIGTDATAALALRLGGRITVPPFDSPYGRAAVLADVTGAEFTVLDRSLAITVIPEEEIGAEVDDPYDD
ncbi:putative enzyme related to lactoylglutathione lyase [Actinokineospora baliensis]|uniref:VOC family protein n=1 Tax=Actinokineospora baliensis TaxID=547056 RepID=UPI00195711A7|nr:VOC family protein [Actinokineospora baliensis]MBM7772863.1 putative enzyme related to lactoylglutathione lyase [Actinokineospora baliensis]